MFVGMGQDRILAKEPAEEWRSYQRQHADPEREKRNRQISGQATHFPNILLVMKHHDDRAGAEKEERLEKCVGEEVEHRRLSGGEANCHDHVSELRQG